MAVSPVSSIKLNISLLEFIFSFKRSFIKIINSKEPQTVPYSTPQDAFCELH